jgi:Flp pilus assembly protein TadD
MTMPLRRACGLKGVHMSWTHAPGRIRIMRWPALAAILVALTGCGGIKQPNLAPSANEMPTAPLVTAGDPSAMLKVARAARQAGDIPAAVHAYQNLVAAKSVTQEVLVEFGDVLLQAGSPDDAIDVYSQVGKNSPARLDALIGMTKAYLILTEPAKALEYADQARALDAQNTRVLIDRGVALDTLGRHAEAQDSYRSVLAFAPRHVAARNNLALSLALAGQFDEAITLMGPLVRSSTATPQVRENMAVIYALKGDADRAATLSRVDLDEGVTQANLSFLAAVRETKH